MVALICRTCQTNSFCNYISINQIYSYMFGGSLDIPTFCPTTNYYLSNIVKQLQLQNKLRWLFCYHGFNLNSCDDLKLKLADYQRKVNVSITKSGCSVAWGLVTTMFLHVSNNISYFRKILAFYFLSIYKVF